MTRAYIAVFAHSNGDASRHGVFDTRVEASDYASATQEFIPRCIRWHTEELWLTDKSRLKVVLR